MTVIYFPPVVLFSFHFPRQQLRWEDILASLVSPLMEGGGNKMQTPTTPRSLRRKVTASFPSFPIGRMACYEANWN